MNIIYALGLGCQWAILCLNTCFNIYVHCTHTLFGLNLNLEGQLLRLSAGPECKCLVSVCFGRRSSAACRGSEEWSQGAIKFYCSMRKLAFYEVQKSCTKSILILVSLPQMT